MYSTKGTVSGQVDGPNSAGRIRNMKSKIMVGICKKQAQGIFFYIFHLGGT